MKLDRNINANGRGKYALLNLRNTDIPLAHLRDLINETLGGQVLQLGDNMEAEFFVIKCKDKYAGPALRAYEAAARADDPEYADEIGQLALNAETHPSKQKPD